MGSTPEEYDFKQNDFVKSPQQNNENEIRTPPRERDRCLCCCTPKVLMIISVIYFILGVLHAVTRGVYLSQCHDIYSSLDSMIPSNLSYNPSTTPTLNIDSWKYIGIYFNDRYNQLQVYQTNDASVTDVTIQIRSSSDKEFETTTTPSSYDIRLAGDGLGAFLSFWSFRCIVNRVDVILPQQIVSTTSSPVNINSHGLDITFKQNLVPYPYPINVKTTSDDINFENVLATSASIQVTSGDVKGSISSLQNGLNVELTSGDINIKASTANTTNGSPTFGLKTTSGDIDLELNVPNVVVKPVVDISATSGDINTGITLASGITDSQITIKTTSGDIDVNLHNSFQGQYQITTTSGDVNVDRKGSVGTADSQGFLQIGATSGDVNVQF